MQATSAGMHPVLERLRGGLIASAQAYPGEPMRDPRTMDQVAQACETWSLSPTRLLFELTEDSIVRNERATIECMHALRNIGCELSIDDFGTGYSSFAYLRQFPVHELKLDRVFIQNLVNDRGDQQIVKALIDLAHAFDLRALAEGVDDPAAVHMLREFGCDRVQGFLYARALPAEELIPWIQRFNQGEAMATMQRDGVSSIDSGPRPAPTAAWILVDHPPRHTPRA